MRTLLISLAMVVSLQSVHGQTTLLPGEAAYDLGDFSKARKELSTTPGADTDPKLQLFQAKIDIAQNKLDDAKALVEKVIANEPDNAQAHTLRGQVYGMKASRASIFKAGSFAKKSLASYEAALELNPVLEDALIGLVRYRLSAPALFGGSVDKAAATAEELMKVNPVTGGLELANINAKRGNDEGQIEILEELAKEHPQDPRAALALGFIEQGARNYDKAFGYFEAAVEGALDNPQHTNPVQAARYQLGRTVVLSRSTSIIELEQGVNALSDYLSGPAFGDLPDFAWAHYRRGLLYERLENKTTEAEQDFAAAALSDDRDLKRALGSR